MQEILVVTSRTSVRPSARTNRRGGGGEAGQPLGTGVCNFPGREIAWQRCIWKPTFFGGKSSY